MNKSIRTISFFLAGIILFASCSSTTRIESTPGNAKVFIDGEYVGVTPYIHTDYRIVGSNMTVKIEKEGFNPLIASISKNEEADIGAIIGGIFFYVPYLWLLKYKPVHSYNLVPATEVSSEVFAPQQNPVDQTPMATKLRELKKLLDDKIITQEEFEKAKTRVLDEKE